MNVYDGIIQGLNEAIAYNEGKGKHLSVSFADSSPQGEPLSPPLGLNIQGGIDDAFAIKSAAFSQE